MPLAPPIVSFSPGEVPLEEAYFMLPVMYANLPDSDMSFLSYAIRRDSSGAAKERENEKNLRWYRNAAVSEQKEASTPLRRRSGFFGTPFPNSSGDEKKGD
jgi:hypothetical protein